MCLYVQILGERMTQVNVLYISEDKDIFIQQNIEPDKISKKEAGNRKAGDDPALSFEIKELPGRE